MVAQTDIHKYTLTTPWDVSTLEFSQSYSFSTQVSSSGASTMTGFIFSANFTKLYITEDTHTGQSPLVLIQFMNIV